MKSVKMAAEQAAREELEAEVEKLKKRKRSSKKLIPKPKGSCGRDYKLREAMGYGSNDNKDPEKKRKYLDCLVIIQPYVTVAILRNILTLDPGPSPRPCHCRAAGLAQGNPRARLGCRRCCVCGCEYKQPPWIGRFSPPDRRVMRCRVSRAMRTTGLPPR